MIETCHVEYPVSSPRYTRRLETLKSLYSHVVNSARHIEAINVNKNHVSLLSMKGKNEM
jgi:hypothetical protein